MEPQNEPPNVKLYSPRQIYVASFLGTPAAAGWFASRTLLRIGRDSQAEAAIWWGVLGTVAALTAGFFLPEKFPAYVLPIAYSAAIAFLADLRFGKAVDRHKAAGGSLGSWWGLALVSLAVAGFSVLVALGVIQAIQTFWPSSSGA